MKPGRLNPKTPNRNPKVSLARAISKLGLCSRTKAQSLISEGRVRVNGALSRDPDLRVDLNRDRIEVDDMQISAEKRIYLMGNKPRGLVTTTSDEKGRETVYECLRDSQLPWLAPVGRLDKASEGLLLFTNDTRWAAKILDPENHVDKTYHVLIDRAIDESLIRQIKDGISTDEGDFLSAKEVRVLRQGPRNSWLEIILDEGKNRHIRRLLTALNINVLRVVRVAIGPIHLGSLAKGAYRRLTNEEVRILHDRAAL